MQLCIGAAQGPYSRGSQMRKLFVVLALVAIAGCSSPVGVEIPEAVDPDVALEFDCNDPEASPTPNTFFCDG